MCSAWRFGDFWRFGDIFQFLDKMVFYIMTLQINCYVTIVAFMECDLVRLGTQLDDIRYVYMANSDTSVCNINEYTNDFQRL